MQQPKLLMSPPEFEDIFYAPAEGGLTRVLHSRAKALEQWKALYDVLTGELHWQVEILPAVQGLPNLTFTAHGGWVQKRTFLRSNFRYKERRGEEIFFEKWFKKNGYLVKFIDRPFVFEGSSGCFFWQDEMIAGYHETADWEAHERVSELFHKDCFSLKLADERFYGTENCLRPLGEDCALVYLPAFDEYSRMAIREFFKDIIPVSEEEALSGACNLFQSASDLIMPEKCPRAAGDAEARGFKVRVMSFSEFTPAGGGPHSLAMRI